MEGLVLGNGDNDDSLDYKQPSPVHIKVGA